MSLPLVNPFESSYEAWSTRSPTLEEMMEHSKNNGQMLHSVNVNLIARVSDAIEAATYISNRGADNGLGRFINDYLDESNNYKIWRSQMPSKTPECLTYYQQRYPNCDFALVDAEINIINKSLSDGQYLFHGGLWPSGASKFVTNRPLSTSFCPQVALRNAEHKGKAYDAGRVDLLVLRATRPVTNVFAFRRAGTSMGHENEVIFASGAELVEVKRILVRSDYTVSKWEHPDKKVNIFVVEVEIS